MNFLNTIVTIFASFVIAWTNPDPSVMQQANEMLANGQSPTETTQIVEPSPTPITQQPIKNRNETIPEPLPEVVSPDLVDCRSFINGNVFKTTQENCNVHNAQAKLDFQELTQNMGGADYVGIDFEAIDKVKIPATGTGFELNDTPSIDPNNYGNAPLPTMDEPQNESGPTWYLNGNWSR